MEMLQQLEPILQIFWYVAIPTSIVFGIQTLMTFVGADSGDGIEADFDADFDGADAPFQLFSFRNLVNFLLGFSWTGISFYSSIESHNWLIALSSAVGVLFVLMFFFVIKQLKKLAEDNTFKLKHAVNKSADVYLTIPGNKAGKGKISLNVKGSYHELAAVTEGETLETGAVVTVVGIVNSDLLLVEKL